MYDVKHQTGIPYIAGLVKTKGDTIPRLEDKTKEVNIVVASNLYVLLEMEGGLLERKHNYTRKQSVGTWPKRMLAQKQCTCSS